MNVIQKLKVVYLVPFLLVISTVVPLVGHPSAFAAEMQAKGTCFYHDLTTHKTIIKSCKSLGVTPQQQDKSNKAVSYSNCYEVDATTSTETITQVKCDGSPLKASPNTQMCSDSKSGNTVPCVTCSDGSVSASAADCGQPATVAGGNCQNLSKCDLMTQYINPLIKVLAALVGVVVVISIIIGGIQYSSSAGDPQAATAAQNRIRNAIIALVVFIFLYALLNFLIPGGLG